MNRWKDSCFSRATPLKARISLSLPFSKAMSINQQNDEVAIEENSSG